MNDEHHKNDEMMMIEIATIKQVLVGMKEISELTYEQTKKTNGRVNKLEEEVTILKIINADESGQEKGRKPFLAVASSVVASIITAVLTAFLIKR